MDASVQTVTCAVTGANGYVGRTIVRHLAGAGFSVIPLQRLRSEQTALPSCKKGYLPARHYALQEEISPDLFQDVHVLVHCAYDFSVLTWPEIETVNVQATLKLFEAARQAGVRRLVFISSLSAFAGCRSNYGRAKLAIEQRAKALELIIVRPGLVYGGPDAGGMMGALKRALSLPAPLLPMVGTGRQPMLLVHEDDLGQLLVTLCREPHVPIARPIMAANEQVWQFRDILRSLARQAHRNVLFVPLSWRLIWCVLKTAERLGLRLRLRSDSLMGLMNQNPSPDFSATREIGVPFRNFPCH